jgi:hypothetical protein
MGQVEGREDYDPEVREPDWVPHTCALTPLGPTRLHSRPARRKSLRDQSSFSLLIQVRSESMTVATSGKKRLSELMAQLYRDVYAVAMPWRTK